MKYVYPIILTPTNSGYTAIVPDLPGCITESKDLYDTIDMARDAISMWLCDAEDNNEKIPPANYSKDKITTLIDVDTTKYRENGEE